MENPPKKFFRLSPGTEVRLRYAYFITCREVVKNAAGEVVELRCTYDPATKGGNAPDGRKVKATMHWVSAAACGAGRGAALQSAVHQARSGRRRISPPTSIRTRWKCSPTRGSSRRSPATMRTSRCSSSGRAISAATRIRRPGELVFNRTVGLRDTWAKDERGRAESPGSAGSSGVMRCACRNGVRATLVYHPAVRVTARQRR